MATVFSPVSPSRTTCGSLLQELQKIWDEIGEADNERDKMLQQLEEECLDIYRRKVEMTRKYKADLCQSLDYAENEISGLASSLGDSVLFTGFVVLFVKCKGTLKQQISAVIPVLEDLRLKKQGRMKDFFETQLQIAGICTEIAGTGHSIKPTDPKVNEQDLTLKRLEELKARLKELQNEKSLRLQKVISNISTIHDLSVVMSIDFFETVNDVHPSLIDSANGQSKSISNDTLARLTGVIHSLKQDKQQRLQKLQVLGRMLIELWNLMDTPIEEQGKWDRITTLSSCSVNEVSRQGSLALEVIEQTEVEVVRLNALKAGKLKELVFKRQNELEEIYRGCHMDVDSDAARQILIGLIESGFLQNLSFVNLNYAFTGNVDLSDLLSSMDDQIRKAKEQALSRKEILDKASLLKTLEEYAVLRQEREEEKRRSREQKRQQEQFVAEQEARYGSRPTVKKPLGQSASANTMAGTPIGRRLATPCLHAISSGKERRESKVLNVTPINYVALPKNDSASRG
ncbi:hypothetical protein GH714_017838 [Hevea brasiliensis]|uniref:65-kDa microtubule-associated protein 5 n=1 Tax=Hevea brasiliensis TaxID=3981 RepID=A0A6A6LIN5_HEVBR|nr:hypothetical protein GH714_017838 [Hevea brasiliensis]